MPLDEFSPRDPHAPSPTTLPSTGRWRVQCAGFFATIRLALMRAGRNPWLLAVVALGIIMADLLICTVPLYTSLVANIRLQNAVVGAETATRNMRVAVHSDANNDTLHRWVAGNVQAQASQYLASFSDGTPTSYVIGDSMTLKQAGSYTFTVFNVQQAQLEAFDYTALRPYMHFIQGGLPQTTAPGQPVQAIITQEMASALDVRVGQRIVLALNTHLRSPITVLVTGIWTPISENDPFWNGLRFESTTYGVTNPNTIYPPPLFPLLTTDANLYAALGALHPMGITQNWVYHVDPARMTTSDIAAITGNLISFRSHVTAGLESAAPGTVNVQTFGSLDQIILSVQQQLGLLALPLYIIAIQLVGLALLFVAAMAALLIESQGQEIATLKSRGASGSQLLSIFMAQSTPIGLFAMISGPFLAGGLSLLLIRWFLSGTVNTANITYPVQVIAPAIIGGALGVVVVIFSGLRASRLDVLAFRREMARPSRAPFWQRYYLDLGLATLCLVGYLEMRRFGDTQTRLILGSQSNSPLLLLTPALLLLSGALLFLRVMPLVARLGVYIANRGRGLTALLAFAQIERAPGRYARVTLLLTLAVGLGLFGLTFDASLSQNVRDRAAYAVGADIRMTVTPIVTVQEASGYLAHLKGLQSVAGVSSLYRTTGSTPVNQGQQVVDMLGVDSATFAGVANSVSWRSDYAPQSLPTLMAQMNAHRQGADTGSAAHPLWAMVSDTLAQQLRLRVGDRFQLAISDISAGLSSFVVGAIIQGFPTLYPNHTPGGFVVLDVKDLDAAISAHAQSTAAVGLNEFWISASGNLASDQALVATLNRQQYDFSLNSVDSYREDLQQAQANPVNSGMRGLLLMGAIVAALLAVVGNLAQGIAATRKRTTQFAILRTLGMARRQLTGLLLGEQAVAYLFGLVGGTLLGLILTTATLPFLQFSDSAVNPDTVGVPSSIVHINWESVGLFYGALVVAFLLALAIAAGYAATIGLGKALRLGED